MTALALWDELDLGRHLLAVLLGTPRLLMIMQISPFMGGAVLTGTLRYTVALACYMVLHPTIAHSLPPLGGGTPALLAMLSALLVKEVFLGLLLGLLAGVLFWAIQCAGYFIDLTRGASNAELSDPLTGEQTTPTGSLLFQGAVYMFFSGGGFVSFLGVIYAGYGVWPVGELLPLSTLHDVRLPLFFAEQIEWLTLHMLLLSIPVVLACLMADVSLGLISRSAPQLNVYVLAMPIKCAVAAALVLVYFALIMTGSVKMISDFTLNLRQVESLLPIR